MAKKPGFVRNHNVRLIHTATEKAVMENMMTDDHKPNHTACDSCSRSVHKSDLISTADGEVNICTYCMYGVDEVDLTEAETARVAIDAELGEYEPIARAVQEYDDGPAAA